MAALAQFKSYWALFLLYIILWIDKASQRVPLKKEIAADEYKPKVQKAMAMAYSPAHVGMEVRYFIGPDFSLMP